MMISTLTEKALEITISKLIASINWEKVAKDLKLKSADAIDDIKSRARDILQSILRTYNRDKYTETVGKDNGLVALVNKYGIFLFAVKRTADGTVKKVSDYAYVLSEFLVK